MKIPIINACDYFDEYDCILNNVKHLKNVSRTLTSRLKEERYQENSQPGDLLYEYKYLHDDPEFNLFDMSDQIIKEQHTLSKGQVLYHAGNLSSGILQRVLSTTLNPAAAAYHNNWTGDAYAEEMYVIYRLLINDNDVMAYVYDSERSYEMVAGEDEVVLPIGLQLTINSERDHIGKMKAYERVPYPTEGKEVDVYLYHGTIECLS